MLLLAAVYGAYYFGLHRGSHLVQTVHAAGVHVKDPQSGRIPGEFEHQDALLLGMNELFDYHAETLVQIVKPTIDRLKIVALVKDHEQEEKVGAFLRARSIDTGNIVYFEWPSQMMWVQDYGPFFVVNGGTTVIDFDYHHPNYDMENLFTLAFAARFQLPYTHAQLSLDGGNLLCNGQGICISTTAVITDNEYRKLGISDIGARLKHFFRFDQWTYLNRLVGEQTGHVDMFATFVSPDQVVVGAYDPDQDSENAAILNQNAIMLSKLKTARGPLKVARVRQFANGDGRFRSYTNVVYANGVLLVPQYPAVAPELDREALELYRKLLPAWKIIGVDCTSLIEKHGALHCVCLNIPKLPELEN